MFTPEEKTYLLRELQIRASAYEKEIATCLEWQRVGVGDADLVEFMLKDAYESLAAVNALIAKAWQI